MSIQEQFEAIGQKHQQGGATIGDGMRASAKTAAWLGGLTLLIKTLPLLVPLIAGGMFFFRGCNVSHYMAPTPVQQPIAYPTQQPQPVLLSRPRSDSRQAPSISRSRRPTLQSRNREVDPEYYQQQQPTVVHGRPAQHAQPAINPAAEAAMEMATEMYQDTPLGLAFQLLPNLARAAQGEQQFSPPTAPIHAPFNFNAPGMSGYRGPPLPRGQHGGSGESELMRGMLSDPNAEQTYSADGMFDTVLGRKFVGTCQMPGEPSKRVELIISRIRDRGSNITARLKLVEGGRKSLNLTGVIEKDPPRLILIPKQHPTSFGMFVTHQPWYSQSPTRITLYIDGAKALSGESVAGEQFELLPKESPQPQPSMQAPALNRMEDGDEIIWTITHRNFKPVADEQIWQFSQTSRKRGNFVWLKAGQDKAGVLKMMPTRQFTWFFQETAERLEPLPRAMLSELRLRYLRRLRSTMMIQIGPHFGQHFFASVAIFNTPGQGPGSLLHPWRWP